jgi:hypothetical protein
LFDPLDYLEVARDLAEREGAGEAPFRAAIGRAYYAIHLKAVWALHDSGLYEPREGAADHAGIIRTLRARRRSAAATALEKLRGLREAADYQLNIEIGRRHWNEAEEAASVAVALLSPDWR